MRRCGFYDEDGDDVVENRPRCARDPWKCTYFRKRFYCPFMDHWDEQKYQEWKKFKKRNILLRKLSPITNFLLWIG